jgi:hypothetical protein
MAKAEVERIAIELVMQLERDAGREPVDVHNRGTPYDIASPPRKIEVKAVSGSARGAPVPLEQRQFQAALDDPENYYVYVVDNIASGPLTAEVSCTPRRFPPQDARRLQAAHHVLADVPHRYLRPDEQGRRGRRLRVSRLSIQLRAGPSSPPRHHGLPNRKCKASLAKCNNSAAGLQSSRASGESPAAAVTPSRSPRCRASADFMAPRDSRHFTPVESGPFRI